MEQQAMNGSVVFAAHPWTRLLLDMSTFKQAEAYTSYIPLLQMRIAMNGNLHWNLVSSAGAVDSTKLAADVATSAASDTP